MTRGRGAVVALLALAIGCSDATAPVLTDVATARAAWLSSQPASYTFEVSYASEWVRRTGYYEITVENHVVTRVRDESGADVPITGRWTIEEHWASILAAKADGALQRATFSLEGLPVEWYVDRAGWADDAHGAWLRKLRKR